MRSLVLEAADFISDLVSRKCGYPHASQSALWVRRVIETWCADEGMFPEDYTIPDSVAIDADLPPSSRFIVNFGVKYKIRRLTFVIQDINSLYTKLSEPNFCDSPSQALDLLKTRIYDCLGSLKKFGTGKFLRDETSYLIQKTFTCPLTGRSDEHTSELQSLMRISSAVFCLKKKKCSYSDTQHNLNPPYSYTDHTQ